ncbi:MAG TPA: MerR family transcriptional regulator [Polyangiales bacterium]
MTDQGGRFRINRVAESTGIPEATLRAWERRYHVPKPSRTPSGYRLYSPDDVAQVRKMRELCEAGVSPADAAKEILEERKPKAADPAGGVAQRAPAPLPAEETALVESAEARLMEVVEPEHTNTAGVLSLSQAIDLMERAASVAAARGARNPAVVVSCGSVELLVPVGPGQLMEASARVVAAREGTISVDVELSVESVQNGKREHVARTTMLLVLLDAPGPG